MHIMSLYSTGVQLSPRPPFFDICLLVRDWSSLTGTAFSHVLPEINGERVADINFTVRPDVKRWPFWRLSVGIRVVSEDTKTGTYGVTALAERLT